MANGCYQRIFRIPLLAVMETFSQWSIPARQRCHAEHACVPHLLRVTPHCKSRIAAAANAKRKVPGNYSGSCDDAENKIVFHSCHNTRTFASPGAIQTRQTLQPPLHRLAMPSAIVKSCGSNSTPSPVPRSGAPLVTSARRASPPDVRKRHFPPQIQVCVKT